MSKEKLVPNMRFKEFKDCSLWKKSLLGNELSLLKDGTHGTHKNIDSNYFLLSAKNIKNGKIYINVDEDRTISKNEFNKIHKNFKLNKNDILLTVVGSIGESAILKDPTNITFQRSVAYLRPNENMNSYFLLSMINTNKFQMELKKQQVVSAQPGVYLNKLNIIDITYPYLSEQQRIGSFFKKIDKMIQLQQSKINKVKDIKSAYLSEMFPKEGEKYPKRRFEGFQGVWKKVRLEQVLNQSGSGGTPRTTREEYYGGDIPFLGISDITNSNGYIFNTEKTITIKGLNNSAAWIVPKESISLAMYASVGKVAILKIKSATSQAFYNMVINNQPTRDYVYQYLVKMESENMWDRIISTGTQANLNAEKVRNLIIPMPIDIVEREKIGQFFKKLDNQILIEEEKLRKLRKLKQAYLNDMFV